MTSEPGLGALDLTVCDREPIRVPGAIQPHGALLVVAVGDGVVRSASVNAAALLEIENVLGLPLEVCSPALAAIVAAPTRQSSSPQPGQLSGASGATFDVFMRAGNGPESVIVELEQSRHAQVSGGADLRANVTAVMATLGAAADVESLLGTLAGWCPVSRLDRVMAYRFEPDGHGVVVAEVRREGLEPFLGLHYPASDIPEQARQLYSSSGSGSFRTRCTSLCRSRPIRGTAIPFLWISAGVCCARCPRFTCSIWRTWGSGPRCRCRWSSTGACGGCWPAITIRAPSSGPPRASGVRVRRPGHSRADRRPGVSELSLQKEARAKAKAVLMEKMAALDSIPDSLSASRRRCSRCVTPQGRSSPSAARRHRSASPPPNPVCGIWRLSCSHRTSPGFLSRTAGRLSTRSARATPRL